MCRTFARACLADPLRSTLKLRFERSERRRGSRLATDELHLHCTPSAIVVFVVELCCNDSRPTLAGGDVVHIDVRGRRWLRASPHVVDHGNGTYTSQLPCSAFAADDGASVRTRLLMQLRRPSLPRRLWTPEGWGELALFDNLFHKKSFRSSSKSSHNLRDLHQCVDEQAIGGRQLQLQVVHQKPYEAPPPCAPGEIQVPYFSRCDGPLDVKIRTGMNLGMGRASVFDHCVYGASGGQRCRYDYPSAEEALGCLRGKRVLLLGDSVTAATYRDLLSIFAEEPLPHGLRYPGTCPDNRTDAELDRAFPRNDSHFLRGQARLTSQSITEARVGLNYTLAYFDATYAELIRTHDVILIESARHDISPPREKIRLSKSAVVKPRLLAEYRKQVNELAERVRRVVDAKAAEPRTAVVWRSPQIPHSEGCPLLDTHVPPLLEEMARIGGEAFLSRGFSALDVLGLTRAAVDPNWWYYTSRGWQMSDWRWVYRRGQAEHVQPHSLRTVTELHTHEASTAQVLTDAAAREGCTPDGHFPHEARVYGWLSRAVTQVTLNRVCGFMRHGTWRGVGRSS